MQLLRIAAQQCSGRVEPREAALCYPRLTLQAVQTLQLLLKALPRVAGQAAQAPADGLAKVAGSIGSSGRGDRKVVLQSNGGVFCKADNDIGDLRVQDSIERAGSDSDRQQDEQQERTHDRQLRARRVPKRSAFMLVSSSSQGLALGAGKELLVGPRHLKMCLRETARREARSELEREGAHVRGSRPSEALRS